jgi:hypothetical protein
MPAPVLGGEINWRETHETIVGYFTNVLEADDGTEQRELLRTIPSRVEIFTISAYGKREVSRLGADLYRAQGGRVTVPQWPDVTSLTVPATAGATALTCETTDRGFVVGGYAVLWLSPFEHERVTVATVASGLLTVSATTQAWGIGTRVLPARVGRLLGDLTRTRHTPSATDFPVTIEYETVLTYGIAGESGEEA